MIKNISYIYHLYIYNYIDKYFQYYIATNILYIESKKTPLKYEVAAFGGLVQSDFGTVLAEAGGSCLLVI